MDNQINDAEYNARLWAKSHPEFIRPGADILKVKKVKPMDNTVAQTIKTPTGIPKRFICKYCDKTFAYKTVYQKHLTRCTVQLNNDTIKPVVKDNATPVQPADMAKQAFREWQQRSFEYAKSHPFSSLEDAREAIGKLQPTVSEDLLKAIAEDTAKPYKPQTGAPWPGPRPKDAMDICADAYRSVTGLDTQTYGTPAHITEPPKSFAMSRIYDILAALILLAILICGIIYAALGIKLLVGL